MTCKTAFSAQVQVSECTREEDAAFFSKSPILWFCHKRVKGSFLPVDEVPPGVGRRGAVAQKKSLKKVKATHQSGGQEG